MYALQPTSISVLSAMFALSWLRNIQDVQARDIVGSRLDYLNPILTGISSRNSHRLRRVQNSLARVVTRWTTNSALNSLHCLPIQPRINFKLATLVHCSLHNTGLQCQFRSAFINLLSQPRYQHYTCLSWFLSCWLSPLKFPPSSSQIYRLLHCLQIQSENATFLWCKHLWPLAIDIHALLIRHNHVDFCVLKLYYVML